MHNTHKNLSFYPLFSIAAAFLFLTPAARADVKSFLPAIQAEVHRCAVIPSTRSPEGHHAVGTMVSTCPTVVIVDASTATVQVDRHEFQAVITPSVSSDDDLYDITLTDVDDRSTMQAQNLLSFGDVLYTILLVDAAN